VRSVGRVAVAVLAMVELLVLLAALAKPAYGYVDPGSGLLAIQVGGSMVAGALFIVRAKIRKFFRMLSPAKDQKAEVQAHAIVETKK